MGKRKDVDLFGNPVVRKQENKNKMKKTQSISRAYKGFRIPSSEWVIPEVAMDSISPEQFYKEYISQRKPCLLTNVTASSDFAKLTAWTPAYLREKAGQVELAIEKRSSVGTSFGESAPRLPLQFGSFLTGIERGDTLRYLTSQTEDYEGDDLPKILAEPLNSLQDDITLIPALFEGMIPYQLNMWMGCSKAGASSGLHHDFHDNLYVLLSGIKRFNIFSPNEVENLYIRGKIKAVLENGMLVYSNSSRVNQEGIPYGLMLEYTQELLEKCSTRIEELKARNVVIEKEYLDDITMDQQYEALYAPIEDSKISFWLEVLNMLLNQLEEEEMELISDLERGSNTAIDGEDEVEEKYPHFSQIPLPLQYSMEPKLPCNLAKDSNLHSLFVEPVASSSMQDKVQYNKCFDAKKASVLVQANQALYLPCGWFHEVTSFNTLDTVHPYHLALNYWFHPCGIDTKDKLINEDQKEKQKILYSSLYWPSFWATRKKEEFPDLPL